MDRFRELLDAAPDAMVIVGGDGCIVFANSQTEMLFGYVAEELLGQPVEILVPERYRGAHPQNRAGYVKDPKVRPMGAGLDLYGRRKDGSEFPAEISLSPVGSQDGVLFTAAVRDITSRKKVEQKFRDLLEAAPDAMVIVEQSGRIVLVNAQTEKLFDYRREELLGQPVERLVPERFRGRHPNHRDAYFDNPRVRAMGSGLDLHGQRRDGSEFPVEISLSPLETENGRLILSAIRDVTERKQIEVALKAANRELEAFSYSVAHDLRAPLRGMNGFAEILLREYSDKFDPDGLDCLHEIQDNALRMGGLIDALLSLSRVARGELKPSWVNLVELARVVLDRLRREEPDRRVEVSLPELLEVNVDPELANTLVANLLGNAWKFSSKVKAPRIELGSELREGERCCFVRDNGAGFDMKYAGKLFAPFQRLHTVGEFPGTGVGLATVQRILHRHGGRIWAEAKLGEGAAFYFTLPTRSIGEAT